MVATMNVGNTVQDMGFPDDISGMNEELIAWHEEAWGNLSSLFHIGENKVFNHLLKMLQWGRIITLGYHSSTKMKLKFQVWELLPLVRHGVQQIFSLASCVSANWAITQWQPQENLWLYTHYSGFKHISISNSWNKALEVTILSILIAEQRKISIFLALANYRKTRKVKIWPKDCVQGLWNPTFFGLWP